MPKDAVNDNAAPAVPLDPAATDLSGTNARAGARKRRDPSEPSAVVGLGASAGGIAALQQFFAGMRPDTGLAFVVVMHLSPEHESQLANVIQQKTSMPVAQVNEAMKVRPNHVYVIPPNKQLAFEDGVLQLVDPQLETGRRVAIDLFFRTLAQAFGQRAVCIIMSGADSDGVIGLKHVRAQGGVTIVQDPNEAEYDSMPVTAISSGMVDWVLPVAAMPAKLAEFVENENRMRLPPEIEDETESDVKADGGPGGATVSDETRDTEDEQAIAKVLADVRAQTGHDFTHYKRATVLRRIARRLQVNSLETIPKYLEFLRTHPAEARALLHDLLIGVTHFFRDPEAFAVLEAHIPQLFVGKGKEDEVRVWVPGCATGEEAYSIAMLLTEHAQRLEEPPQIQIFATDLDDESIADARQGIYPSTIEADVSPGRLREFFQRDHGRYRVRKEIREKVLFAVHSMLSDAPFSRCDMVSCRNLLIYLKADAQKQAFDIFHFALRAGGLLFLGTAENHGAGQALFSPVDAKHRLFVRRSMPRPLWRVPNLPVRAGATPVRAGATPVRAGATPVRAGSGWRSRLLPPLTHDVADETASATPESLHARQTRRDALFGELHLRLLEEYGPPSVVVNDAHDIVHLSESAGRYLRFVAGEPTANIARVIHPALQIETRTALFKASQTKQNVRSAPQRVELEGGAETIVLHVRPMKEGDLAHGFYLLLFEKQHAAVETPRPAPAHAGDPNAADELQFLKEQLAASTEQYEARNEELKASNEELQAMNEEMRSATEELETSKEELQSVNEELSTVNAELKNSVDDLSRANADLNNLMASTDIGTIFLDRQLRIQRFTPSAQKIFNLIPSDMGRPISDITSSMKYEGFLSDLQEVLDDLHTVEREVRAGGNGSWYMTRMAPYRTADDRIVGVVVTFIDITRRKNAEEELRTSDARLRRALQIETVGVIFFRTDGTITGANDAFLRMSGYTPDDVVRGRLRSDEMTPDEFSDASRHAMEELRTLGRTTPYQKQYIRKDGSRFWALFAAKRIDDTGHAVEFVVDTSESHKTQEALEQSEERFRTVADNVPQLIWTNDGDGKANYFNKRWYQYTGLTLEESCGEGWEAVVHPDDEAASVERWKRALETGEVFDAEYRLRRSDGEYRWFIGRNVPLRANGKVLSWFGTATDIDDLKRAEAAQQESEERFRLLVEGAKDYAMFLLNLDNIITYWSAGAERIFGWSAEEAEGQTGDLIFTEEDRAKGEVEKEIGQAMKNGRAPDRRWHRRKDGSRLWVDGVMTRLNDENGEPRGLAKIARDATEQRRAEDELRHARDQLEQRVLERTADLMATNNELERAMSQRDELERELLAISERERRRIGQDLHDIVCQELTATALFLKSAGNKADDVETAKTLNEAAQVVNRNVAIARDLARGFQPSVLSGAGGLPAALRTLCKDANERPGVHCTLKLPRTIRVRDETIALNLFRIAQEAMRNAISHSGGDEIVICIEREKDWIRLVIEDNGKGFRPKKAAKGLGLHIMKYRANVLGGELRINSGPKGGTRVVCEVPIKK